MLVSIASWRRIIGSSDSWSGPLEPSAMVSIRARDTRSLFFVVNPVLTRKLATRAKASALSACTPMSTPMPTDAAPPAGARRPPTRSRPPAPRQTLQPMGVDPSIRGMMDVINDHAESMGSGAYCALAQHLKKVSDSIALKESGARRALATQMIVEQPACIGTCAVY